MDIKHHYIRKGTGDIIVLLHGNGENAEYFRHQIEEFSEDYCVIAVDTRGHGKTPRGEAPFTIRQFAEDLKCFFDSHNITKANILGFSDGANTAMIFAMRYPEMVNSLILNGGNLDTGGVKPSVQLPIVLGFKTAGLFARTSQKAKKNAEMLGLMVNDPNIKPQELSGIRARTLVVTGDKDMIKTSHTTLIANNIPGAVLKIIKGDHFIANKNYKEFNEAVKTFLNDNREENIL